MISHRLTHSVFVRKAQHAKAGQRKATEWDTSTTVVPARVDPLADTPTATILGGAVSESYRVYFEAGTDVEEGDRIVWVDRTPFWVLLVQTVQDFSGFETSIEDHLEVTAIRQRAGT